MPERLHNPEMDRLVQEMNRMLDRADDSGSEHGPSSSSQPLLDGAETERVLEDEALSGILEEMVRRRATDLLLIPGAPPAVRTEGRLSRLERSAVDGDGVRALFQAHLGPRARHLLETNGSADFSLRLAVEGKRGPTEWRLRVNLQRQRRGLAAAVRVLPKLIPSLADLHLPEELAELVIPSHGLVLVSGPTGSGKSTTLASLVDVINRTSFRHVITIEEPVEYEHRNRSSIIEQVEIGRDAPDFATALRSALRRDPDVILVGEMRDLETMATALTAAETGHLILSTLHTGDVSQAVHRIVDVFPAGQQDQVRQQLSLALGAVVCQQLVPRADGAGRVPAVEILTATYAVRNLIRKGQLERLYNELLTGGRRGMRTLEASLAELVDRGAVSAEEARSRCSRLDELERRMPSLPR
jgi:twitching motility protein PilT